MSEETERPQKSKRPAWLKVGLPSGDGYRRIKSIVDTNRVHTVCQEARCPNIGECWACGTGTFMILGDTCSRACGFCAVKTGKSMELDHDEPRRVAESARLMGLKHVVITSVNRDYLPDGGAGIWAETIRQVRKALPKATLEVLIPDFEGHTPDMDTVFQEQPDILNHNLETVPRLYPAVRPQAIYQRSLNLLAYAKSQYGLKTKSGLMVGLGEDPREVQDAMKQLKAAQCDLLTLGQYLQPTPAHIAVERFVTPEEFEQYRIYGLELGFMHVESAPLVRSSYHAAMPKLHINS